MSKLVDNVNRDLRVVFEDVVWIHYALNKDQEGTLVANAMNIGAGNFLTH
jgi:hypothetical protein